MNKIIFIVQQLSQPRCIKRIESVIEVGYNYQVFGFKNGLYENNLNDLKFKINESRIIDKNYSRFRKIVEYYKFIYKIIKQADESDIIYTFGFEIGTIVSFFKKNRMIYEEADISAARFKNDLIRKALIWLDKRTIKNSILTVFTSNGFKKYLYGENCPFSDKILLLHNKLHNSFLIKTRPSVRKINLDKINFGFIGLIRYPNTILRFARVVGEFFPNHSFHFWGDAEGDCLSYVDWERFNNIYFHGSFSNPEDLDRVYSEIDINIACYDTNSGNVRIAEPNKLYESIFFYKPLVVSEGTFLEERIKELGVGFSLNSSKDNAIFDFIQKLDYSMISKSIDSMKKIDKEDLISDSNELIEILKTFLNK